MSESWDGREDDLMINVQTGERRLIMRDHARFRGHALIIGAMKAGTTSLHHMLAQHPQIAAHPTKELNYFCREDWSPDDYYALFDIKPGKHAWTLDSSPEYAKGVGKNNARIATRIAQLPNSKLIYILRDPIERADSHIAHQRRRGNWRERAPYGYLRDVSAYAARLDDYAAAGLTDVLLLDFAELADDPAALVRRVTDFLDLEPIPRLRPLARHRRSDPTRVLPKAMADKLARDLAPDVERLVEHYGFEPARTWSLTALSSA